MLKADKEGKFEGERDIWVIFNITGENRDNRKKPQKGYGSLKKHNR